MKNGNHAFVQKMYIVTEKYKSEYFGKHLLFKYGINVSLYMGQLYISIQAKECRLLSAPVISGESEPTRGCVGTGQP